MAATEVLNGDAADMALEIQELSEMVSQQVNEILEEASLDEASQGRKAPKTFVAYRIPMAGVRYYF